MSQKHLGLQFSENSQGFLGYYNSQKTAKDFLRITIHRNQPRFSRSKNVQTGFIVFKHSNGVTSGIYCDSRTYGKTFGDYEAEILVALGEIYGAEGLRHFIFVKPDSKGNSSRFSATTAQKVLDRIKDVIISAKTLLFLTNIEDGTGITVRPAEEGLVKASTKSVEDSVQPSTSDARDLPAATLNTATTDMGSLEEALRHVEYNDDSSEASPEVITVQGLLENSFYLSRMNNRHIKKFNLTEINHAIKFKEAWNNLDFADVLTELQYIFESALKSATADLHATDRIKVFLNHESLQVPITVPLMLVSELTAETILEAIERVLQSEKHITFDGTLRLDISTIRVGRVGGKRLYTHCALDGTDSRRKKSIITITGHDNMCMARSVLLGVAALRKDKNYEKLRKTYRMPQTIAARKLLCTLKLNVNIKHTIETLGYFERHFNVQCIVISCMDMNAIVYRGLPRREKIFLYKRGDHLDLIKNIKGFFCKDHYCDNCLVAYNSDHNCSISCTVCDTKPCITTFEIECNRCHQICRSQNCLVRHRQARPKSASVCETYWRCVECTAVIESKKCSKAQHVCGNYLCPNCKQYADVDHSCYITHETPKTSTDKYIFYDFETIQESGRHIPNLCIALKVCANCIDEIGICKSCGDPKNKYSTYYVFANGADTVNEFGNWLIDSRNKNYVAIAHNAKGFDSHFLLDYLVRNSVKPEVIFSGSKIMSVTVHRGITLRLYDSHNYLAMPLKALPRCFGLEGACKGDFPHLFNRTENQNYKGKYPDLSYYSVGRMKSPEREEFLAWYDEVKDTLFDFKKELIAYCRKDVEILALACLKFRKLFKNAAGVDPLQYITIASACMASYKSKFCQEIYELDGRSVTITDHKFPLCKDKKLIKTYFPYIKLSRDIFSAASIRWLTWVAHEQNIYIQHACNEGEYKVPGTRYKLDGFYESTRTAYEFHSCVFHGCLDCESKRKNKVVRLNQSANELFTLTMRKKHLLIERGYKYECLWYHEYEAMLKNNARFKSFVDKLDIVERLDPRDALYGGRTNAVCLYYKPKADEKINYVDFTSLYPYINKTRTYMTCPPEIITSDFQDIGEYFGFVKCIMLPPRGLLHPLLPMRMGGKLLFPLCRTCAEVGLFRKCRCKDADRWLKATWATVEIQKALTLNYKIIKIYEVWHYPETMTYSQDSKGLFSDYINCFLKFKEQASGYPSTCVTMEEKALYKQQYFEREGVHLDEMCRNEGLRTVAKLCLNSLWGKFAQRSNMPQVIFVNTTETFFCHLSDPAKIVTDFKVITDDMIMLVYTNSESAVSTPKFANVPIACLTTAYARLHLYSIIENLGDRLLYFDTDSLIYIDRKGEWSPATGPFLGELKDEVPGDSIIEFASAGPKNYAYLTLKGKSVCKVRGITLNHDNAKLVNFQKMKQLIDDHQLYVDVPETRFVRSKKDFSIRNVETSKRYKFTYTKRMLLPDLTTLPYGY
ncbi:putative DNA polymerase [Nymphon striatum]|nr:putative DNA polymerase [Nymphon striatum]